MGRGSHRAALFHLLWRHVQVLGLPVVCDARIDRAGCEGDKRRLHLRDGRDFGPFDPVVDASGAGSTLSPMQARPLGYGAIWGAVPWPQTELSRDTLRQQYRGASRMAGVLPIGHLPNDPTPRAAILRSMLLARPSDQSMARPGRRAMAADGPVSGHDHRQ